MSSSNRPLDERRPFDLVCMGRVAVDLYAEQIHSPMKTLRASANIWGDVLATYQWAPPGWV